MAGIGFELKKLFSRRGLFASFRAYGYAGIICTGPMLLGIVLLLGVMFLCDRTGASKQSRELLVCMITYTLLASLTVTSFLSMVVTRFIADMLYEEKNEAVLSSFWGSTGLMLIAGGILYGIFLIFSGVGLIDKFLCFELFGELIVTWNAMSYLTAIKDYRGIMLSFLAAIAVTFLSGALLLFLGISHVEALMAAVCIGYGIMLLWDVVLLYEYFPQSDISAFLFLRWADEFLPLAFTGLCINIGLFAHLVIMWAGPLGKQVKGLFYGAPSHDVPALIAFLTILITTVNFVVSVEVNFYPKYRNYYSLFNDGGTIKDIMQAGTEMLDVLNRELKYTALKQLLTTALAISMGESLLKYLPLGFNDLMYGYFRTLCVGLCGGKYHTSVAFIFYRLQGSIGCFCDFCRGNFCVYCDFSVLSAGILWLWVSCRMCTVLFYSYDPSGTLYQTSAILYSQHTAGGSRRQIGGIYQNRMFYG